MNFQVDYDDRKNVWVAWCHQATGKDWAEGVSADSPTEALFNLIEILNEKVR